MKKLRITFFALALCFIATCAQAANSAPQIISVSPDSGSQLPNAPCVFTTTFADPDGYRNINYAIILINTTQSSGKCFYGYYQQSTNQLWLASNSGATRIGGYRPGTAKTIENSYVKLDCAKSSVVRSGNTLTIRWAVTFKQAFAGSTAKNIYLYIRDNSGAYFGWIQKGTCVVGPNAKPLVVSVTPSSSATAPEKAVTLATVYKDANGFKDIKSAQILVNTSANQANSFYASYNQNENKIYLRDDANTAWTGGYAPGSAATIENNAVKIDCAKTKVSGSGNNLNVSWAATFKGSRSEPVTRNVYLYAADSSNAADGLTQKGTVYVEGPPVPDFTANVTSGPSPLNVQFTDKTTGGAVKEYAWFFGDETYPVHPPYGAASTEKNPAHTYKLDVETTGFDYKSRTLPQDAGMGWVRNAGPVKALEEIVDGGIMHLKCDFNGGYTNYSRPTELKAGKKYAVETRFKLGQMNCPATYGAMSLFVCDDTYGWRLDFDPNGVSVVVGATVCGRYQMDTTSAYHNYRVVAENGFLSVYIDGNERIWANVSISKGVYSPLVAFGTMVSGGGVPAGIMYAEGYWDYIITSGGSASPTEAFYTVSLWVVSEIDYCPDPDIAIVDFSTVKTDYIRVTAPAPVLTQVSPQTADVGERVTLTGLNFGPFQGPGLVTFAGNKQGDIVSWTNSSIVCFVPAGAVSGALTVTTASGTSNFMNFTVGKPPAIVTESLPEAVTGEPYSAYLNASHGLPPYSWSIAAGSLPAGLVLDSAAGKISGTASAINRYDITVKVTDAAQQTDTRALSINVVPFPTRTDEELLDKTEAQAAMYFYEQVLANGFVKDGAHRNWSSIAATGFGLASMCVIADRYQSSSDWNISPELAKAWVNNVLDNCINYQDKQATPENINYKYGRYGFLYRYIKADGTRFETYELSSIDMALFIAGAITAGEYFGDDVKAKVEQILTRIDWNVFINKTNKQFYYGWRPETLFTSGTWDRPSDETILISLMAIAQNPDNQDYLDTMYSWPRVGRSYARHSTVNSFFGSLFTYFFAHIFFDFEKLGEDMPYTAESGQVPVDWWKNSVDAAYANRQYCIDNQPRFASYGPDSWGITACENPGATTYLGRIGAAPCEVNGGVPEDNGVIAPYGAISCMPLMRNAPDEALNENLAFKALRHYHDTYYKKLWGKYGPHDSFDNSNAFNPYYYGINVGPIALMIENYRTGLLWTEFMKNERIIAAVQKVFSMQRSSPTMYVDVHNAGDGAQDGSAEHPFSTITRAINAAIPGDIISVAGGVYNETITLNKCGITLDGTYGAAIIVGTAQSPAVYCSAIDGDPTTIRGFTIKRVGDSSGIRCAGSVKSLRIMNNIITGGDWQMAQQGYGVYLENNAACSVLNNTIEYHGTGIRCAGYNTVTVNNNLIDYCRISGGIVLMGSNGVIKKNTIQRNWGSAISVINSTADIAGNKLTDNTAWSSAGGIELVNGTVTARNNIISFCRTQSINSAPAVNACIGTLNLCNNIFYYNFGYSTTAVSAAVNTYNTNLVAKNNIFMNNTNAQCVMAFYGTGSQDFAYNDLWNNSTGTGVIGAALGPGNINMEPVFANAAGSDFHLLPASPCIDTGDPSLEFNDKDGTRNDMGIYGGPMSI